MFVTERFNLNQTIVDEIQSLEPNFGYNGFGEFVFYRTYSRQKPDGNMETWNDVVIRVVEGTFSIRKNHYIKNHIAWDEDFWQVYSRQFALSLFHMMWLPPGRGLWAMGTDFVYERGSMALNNCGAVRIGSNIGDGIHWLMDALMCGVGVGFHPTPNLVTVYQPQQPPNIFVIPDTREGWCDATKLLIDSYLQPYSNEVVFDYSEIRGPGLPIKGFGGLSSGAAPLKRFHGQIREYFYKYQMEDWYSAVHLKTDIANACGCCVISGNVRRSAELALGSIDDPDFVDLKNYNKYPYRADIGWVSNNSVILEDDEDFEKLDVIASRVVANGEPGFINLQNFPKGRIGKNDPVKPDFATCTNPCGEIPLEVTNEGGELCCLADTLPTRCSNHADWLQACEYAACYASTVTLLPTHRPETNRIIAKNRRIGVGIIDVSGWKHAVGTNKVVKFLRKGYERIRKVNQWLNAEAGVPEAIRVTTVKPGGTTPKLAGRTAGVGHPNFHYTIRRVRVAANSPIVPLLQDAHIPYEPDVNDPKGTLVFEWPIQQGPAKPATEVTIWEQATNIVMMQREWSDNAVSNTLNFRPKWVLIKDLTQTDYYVNRPTDNLFIISTKDFVESYNTQNYKLENHKIYEYDPKHEEEDIESLLSAIAPQVKSVSLLPQTPDGVYPQMPESGITREEYEKRTATIKKIDWDKLTHNVAEPDRYCTSESCEVK